MFNGLKSKIVCEYMGSSIYLLVSICGVFQSNKDDANRKKPMCMAKAFILLTNFIMPIIINNNYIYYLLEQIAHDKLFSLSE